MTDPTQIPQGTPQALVRAEGADDGTLDGRWRYAKAIAEAGDVIPKSLWAPVRQPDGSMSPPQPSAGKVLAVTEVARMLGFHPLAGLMGVHIIEGRPTLSAAIMSAKIRTSGHRLRVGTRGSVDDLSLVGWASLIRHDDREFEYRVEWTLHDAVRAGLGTITNGKWGASKDNWRKYPRAMLKARAIAEVIREAAEDELMGAAYLPDELGADTNEQGEPVGESTVAPSRDWAGDIEKLRTMDAAAILREELRNAPDYSPHLWGLLLAKVATMQDGPAGPGEAVYDADGSPEDGAPDVGPDGVVHDDEEPPAPDDDVIIDGEIEPGQTTVFADPNEHLVVPPSTADEVEALRQRAAAAKARQRGDIS